MSRLLLDALAEGDDRVVGAQRRGEAVDVGELSLDDASRGRRKRVLVAGDDLLLQGEQLAIAIHVPPRPRRPLDLNAGDPVAIEAVIEKIESRSADARAPERR